MNDDQIKTIEQVREFLTGISSVKFSLCSNAHEGRVPSPRKMKDPYGGDSGARSINSLET